MPEPYEKTPNPVKRVGFWQFRGAKIAKTLQIVARGTEGESSDVSRTSEGEPSEDASRRRGTRAGVARERRCPGIGRAPNIGRRAQERRGEAAVGSSRVVITGARAKIGGPAPSILCRRIHAPMGSRVPASCRGEGDRGTTLRAERTEGQP